jgi:hypothetical protein
MRIFGTKLAQIAKEEPTSAMQAEVGSCRGETGLNQ